MNNSNVDMRPTPTPDMDLLWRLVVQKDVVNDALRGEIERLRTDCAEAYQAVGFLADCLGYWTMAADDPRQAQITKLLNNLSHAANGDARPHDDLLPFGWQA